MVHHGLSVRFIFVYSSQSLYIAHKTYIHLSMSRSPSQSLGPLSNAGNPLKASKSWTLKDEKEILAIEMFRLQKCNKLELVLNATNTDPDDNELMILKKPRPTELSHPNQVYLHS